MPNAPSPRKATSMARLLSGGAVGAFGACGQPWPRSPASRSTSPTVTPPSTVMVMSSGS